MHDSAESRGLPPSLKFPARMKCRRVIPAPARRRKIRAQNDPMGPATDVEADKWQAIGRRSIGGRERAGERRKPPGGRAPAARIERFRA
jgi:hypothetical protein